MTEANKQELRAFYKKDYMIKTGDTLVCIEKKRVSKGSKKLHKDMVVSVAAKWFDVPVEKITGTCREKEVVECKQMIAKVLSSRCKCSSFEIAARLGNMERSTISNTLARFETMYKTDKGYKERFNTFNRHCTNEFNTVTYYENSINK